MKRKRDTTTTILSCLSCPLPMDLAIIINDYSGIHNHFELDSWTSRPSWSFDPSSDKGQVIGLIGGDLENWEKGEEEWIGDIPSSYQPMVSAWIVSLPRPDDVTVVAEELVLMKNGSLIELVPTDEDEGFEDLATVGQEMLQKEFILQTNKGLTCGMGNILIPPRHRPPAPSGEKQAFQCFEKRIVLLSSGKVTIGGEPIRSIREPVYGMDDMWWEDTHKLFLFLTCLTNVLLLEINVFRS